MLGNSFKQEDDGRYRFYGDSELLAQIVYELQVNPESCLSKNIQAWYTSLYSEEQDFTDCRYQIEINEELCEENPPDSLEAVIELILSFVEGNSVRVARAAIRIVCREALRQIAIRDGADN